MNEEVCPCGSKKTYSNCCFPFVNMDELAPDPESLMRSRYTAFVKEAYDYLKASWHPETCPQDLGEGEPSNWIGLEIVSSGSEGDQGEVEFIARLIYGNKLETLHEVSDFERIDGRWLYVRGEFLNEGNHISKISKSADCPCGSGKKFKRCHGRDL